MLRLDPGTRRPVAGIPDRRRARQFQQQRAPGEAPFFVIEADEYDTAFFDKRAKFVHYRPRTAGSQQPRIRPRRHLSRRRRDPRQFNQLLRTVPGSGRIVRNAATMPRLAQTLNGLLDAAQTFGLRAADATGARARAGLGECGEFDRAAEGACSGARSSGSCSASTMS
jgi:UDP-N-acetylmuramate-alanine ligase